ncbi:MAG: YihY/virulence factor BrkB family protein [Thermoleophilia bacterium]|nr:YihY/virulence factor BrkB family protein [Thermoleophilia bacterium]
MNKLRGAASTIRMSAREWLDDKASMLAAALSFFAILSLAPLLLLIVSVTGILIGEGEAKQEIISRAGDAVGESGRVLAQTVLDNAGRSAGGVLGAILGAVLLLFGATGLFAQLQSALNRVWHVEPEPGKGARKFLKKRLLSFLVILGVGFLLLFSLVLGAITTAAAEWSATFLGVSNWLPFLINLTGSLVLLIFLFAFIYKVLPDVEIGWPEVWYGAFFTAVLFVIGNILIGFYLRNSGTASTYGAFGSLVVVLLWVYYSAQVVLFGAEFTKVYARRHGNPLRPQAGARRVPGARLDRV